MLAAGSSKNDTARELGAPVSEIDYLGQIRPAMPPSVNCVFPQAALYLDFRACFRLCATSRDTIPEDWANEVWLSSANNGHTGFQFSNIDKQTIRDLMTYVVSSTPVRDTEPVVVDSMQIAKQLVQVACQTLKLNSMPCLSSVPFAATFLTRFFFDREELEDCLNDPSEVACSFPEFLDIGQERCLIELVLVDSALKLNVQNLKNDEEEPKALCHPLHVQLHSLSSPVVFHMEYILTHEHVDETGCGTCLLPSSPDVIAKALIEGVVCMVSLVEVAVQVGTCLKYTDACHLEGMGKFYCESTQTNKAS